jgi:sugar lactone lactonase YvrE
MTKRALAWAAGLPYAAALLVAASFAVTPLAAAPRVSVLVPAAPLHAIEGMAFGPDGALYGTSVYSRRIYRIDTRTGAVTYPVSAPFGEADDIAFGPAGTPAAGIMAWTAQRSGELRIRRPDGRLEVLLVDVPRVNPVAFTDDGRLFTAQSRAGDDALWELDVTGQRPPRRVSQGRGPLNGFDFAADGVLYAPAFGSDKLVAIDVASGEHRVVAEGLGSPAAVKVDRRDGSLVSIDYMKGELWRTDLRSGRNILLATFPDVIDNVTLGPDGLIYLPSVADSRVLVFDPRRGTTRRLVDGRFTVALGATMVTYEGREMLLVADPFGYRFVDPQDGTVIRPPWVGGRGMSSAVAANDRYIAFTYSGTPRVRVIDRRSDAIVAEITNFTAPRGLVLTRDDDIIVADAGTGRLIRIRDDQLTAIATGLAQPVAVALDGDTAVLVTEHGSGRVLQIELATGTKRVLGEGLVTPSAVARLRDGRIAVLEQTLGRIVAIDSARSARSIIATDLPTSLAGFHFSADTTTGLAVTTDGALLVTCAVDNTVRRIDF